MTRSRQPLILGLLMAMLCPGAPLAAAIHEVGPNTPAIIPVAEVIGGTDARNNARTNPNGGYFSLLDGAHPQKWDGGKGHSNQLGKTEFPNDHSYWDSQPGGCDFTHVPPPAAGGGGVGSGDVEPDGDRGLEADGRSGVGETAGPTAAAETGACWGDQDLTQESDTAMKPAPRPKKKYYSLAEANATLPLLRVILRDITALATVLRDRYQRLVRLQNTKGLDQAHREEVQQLVEEFERGQQQMNEYEMELDKLGIELKDYYTGLIDFRHKRDGREVYLCWKLGEPDISHWHELDAGFSGRQKLETPVLNG